VAEAEDVIVDAARHATVYAQDLLRRRRVARTELSLLDIAPRLDWLLAALHNRHWPLRVAQPPPPVTPLIRLFQRQMRPWRQLAVPTSNGEAIWLPRQLDSIPAEQAMLLYRAMALQQAQRASVRDEPALQCLGAGLPRDLYLVLEAEAADAALARMLPGLQPALRSLRATARHLRPVLERFPLSRQPLERWLRERVARDPASGAPAGDLLQRAAREAARWPDNLGPEPLLKDWWTGDWPSADRTTGECSKDEALGLVADDDRVIRSARLDRRPSVRQADENEDEARPGAWMIQTTQSHEHAEDPMGLQRPSDRDAESAAEAHAESVSELPQARLVQSPERAHEVLLSDDPPPPLTRQALSVLPGTNAGIRYPEWDFRTQTYRDPGSTVWESLAEPGQAEWVERTIEAHRHMLTAIQRRFEMLRTERTILHRQEDGDDIDLDACIEARADVRSGASLSQRLYKSARIARRDAAVLVLIDISGSTDSWVAGQKRVIDVEREALLPLSIALDGTGVPHAILAFAGDGPQRVLVRGVKRFDEPHGDEVALRIAGLAPERYTRTGAALRHASRLLGERPARQRLLLLLSDGKPNDLDDYEGRYGVEDMRQAVREARQAGQSLFCLTVQRQAAAYLSGVFGAHHYALLQRPERLPIVLLDWLKQLLAH
jgi:nitric oxide reductase NorD protein